MLIEKFQQQVALHSCKIAVKSRDKIYTYNELDLFSNRIARAVKRRVKPIPGEGTVVGLLFEHGVHMIAALLGALKGDCIYMPLDNSYPESRLRYMMEHSGASLILTNRANHRLAQSLTGDDNSSILDVELLEGDISGDTESSAPLPRRNNDGNKIAYILYTSGSTGKPKGVYQTHRNTWYFIQHWIRYFSITHQDNITLLTAFSHDGAVPDIYSSLLSGAALFPFNIKNVQHQQELSDFLVREEITIWHSVPTLFRYFVNSLEQSGNGNGNDTDFSLLRFIQLGGETLRSRDAALLKQHFPNCMMANVYGQTESTVNSIALISPADTLDTICIGESLEDTEIFLVDEDGQMVEDFGTGEIVVACDHIAPGYWRDPDNTSKNFSRDPEVGRLYWTGDIGGLLEDGNIEIMGRKDQQVKIRGFRVETGEIESVLLQHPHIREAVVTAGEDITGDKYLCAYVVGGGESGDLRSHLMKNLPDYMVPTRFVRLDAIPLTPSGKINRNALPEPGAVESPIEYTPPGDAIEMKLVEIWAGILKLPPDTIGRDHNFFELGGHSLKAVTLSLKIHHQLNVKIELPEIFAYATIEQLAQHIRESEREVFNRIGKCESREVYPLSSAQKRLYILQQLDKESIGYNIPVTVILEGSLDLPRLETAFRQVMARHESLRTSMELWEDRPVQRIHELASLEISLFEIISENPGEKEREIRSLIQNFIKPFDLSRPPLMRTGIIKTGKSEHLLIVDIHHAVTDGTSMAILVNEVMVYYAGGSLPPLDRQYTDYVLWQNSGAQQSRLEKQERYWQNVFSGEIPVLQLPIDFSRPGVQQFGGKRFTMVMDRELTGALKSLARQNDVTLFTLLISLYFIFLAKLSSQEDIIVGTPLAGRNHADVQNIIGMFVSTLALRGRPGLLKTFPDFLQEIKEITLAAFANSEYPFEHLVEWVDIVKDASRNPLFDTMFVLQNFETVRDEIPAIEIPELKLKPYPFDAGKSMMDLTVTAAEVSLDIDGAVPDGLQFTFEYCTSLFLTETIHRFGQYFEHLIRAVLEKPSQRLAEFDLISEEEKQRLLETFNDTTCQYPADKTIPQLFREHVEKTPDRIAVIGNETQLSYDELNRCADHLASSLNNKGIRPGFTAALDLHRSIEMVIDMLGILKAGGAYLPIDPEYPRERIGYMLEDSRAAVLLTPDELSVSIPETTDGQEEYPVSQAVNGEGGSGSPAYIMYTSGTTGKPKGVIVTHRNVVRLVKNTGYIKLDSGTRLLQTGAPVFDATTFEIWGPLLNGGQLAVVSKDVLLDAQRLGRELTRHGTNTLWLSSPLFNQLTRQNSSIFSGLGYLLVGGDILSPPLINRVRSEHKNLNLINGYGPTENTTFSTTFTVDRDFEFSIPIGKPINNSTAYILDFYGRLQPIGVPGELYVGGDGIAAGYLNNPDLTADKFLSLTLNTRHLRLYKTGDLARWLPDGNIQFAGRIDGQVKIRGFRVEQGEIENRLLAHPDVKEAVVVVRSKGDERYLCAYIVAGCKNLDSEVLRQHLSRSLPQYMIPVRFVSMEFFPLTPNGKIDRRALPEPGTTVGREYIEPTNETERKLAELWQDLLNIHRAVGIDEDFFVIGGHSLNATIMASMVHRVFQVKLPLAVIFRSRTIRDLAQFINQAVNETYFSVPPREMRDYYPLSSAQKRLYILQQTQPDSRAYNITQALQLTGSPDKSRLERAFRLLIRRHESFRTSFHLKEGQPVQRIRQGIEFNIVEINQVDPEGSINQFIDEFIQPFDLSLAPLLRAGLVKTGKQGHLLMVDMHHIISDGVSVSLLVSEFSALYLGQPLPALSLQYRDYSLWENSESVRKLIDRQEAWWLKQLPPNEKTPALSLPLDYPRPSVQQFDGSAVSFEIPEPDVSRLNHLARKENVTLFMALLSVFYVLLSRLSGQEDIIVGIPIAGRRHPDLQPIIGMFVNTLAVRAFPCGNKTFEVLLREVGEWTTAAFEHQEYPFEDLVEKTSDRRDASRNPLFDVMFVLQNADQNRLSAKTRELTAEPVVFENRTAKFDLTLQAMEEGGSIHFLFEYCIHLFKEETVLRFSRYFKNMTAAILENPVQRLAEIDFIPLEEKQKILETFNDTATQFRSGKSIHRLFAEQAAISGDYCSVVYGPLHVSYGELNRRANNVAAMINEGGISPKSIVAIKVKRSVEMITGILGILKSGCAYLPIGEDYPRDRIDYMLRDSKAQMLLTIDDIYRAEHTTHNFRYDAGEDISDTLAYIIYTSGSTGRPKGVMVRNLSLVNLVSWFSGTYGLGYGQHLLNMSDYTFDASVNQFFGTLLYGAVLFIIDKALLLDTLRLRLFIDTRRINIVNFVPVILKELLVDQPKLKPLQTVISGADRLDETTKNKILELGYRLHNHYGPTETTVDVLSAQCSLFEPVHLGRPINNVQVYILDRHGCLLPLGAVGELCVSGIGLASGYLNRPELTAERFNQLILDTQQITLYRTGDLARWLPDGNIQFLGRIDLQVKIRGFRVELGEIETLLSKHPGVEEAVVVAVGTNENHSLCAYIVAANILLSKDDLRDDLSRWFPSYMIPGHFVILDALPLTVNGKIDRSALPEPEWDGDGVCIAPGNETEKKIEVIWREVLQTEKNISVIDDFFTVGGNSLKMLRLAARIHQQFGAALPVSHLFGKPTIKAMAKAISTYRSAAVEEYVVFNENMEETVFCFPPAVGFGIAYAGLADHLPDYRFIAFNFIECPAEAEPKINKYRDIINRLQPGGDLVLLGYSAGGKVALKTAAALERIGRPVSHLILMDSYQIHESNIPGSFDRRLKEQLRTNIRRLGLEYMEHEVMRKRDGYQTFYRHLGDLEPVSSDIHLITAAGRVQSDGITPEMHWDNMTHGEYTILEGHGNHYEMLSPENIEKNTFLVLKILIDRPD